ncbi:hypothetical protein EV421DRAFT_1717295 [Armillaria borealis]|uniref:Uncharacterized protein n=1 Tax=Armillaria borealis TaxID=47425 RepID=A0AA39J253_9AGAR|nr:hypothetical protein EV421DRAFT_1717295 [Armillaria borealis]
MIQWKSPTEISRDESRFSPFLMNIRILRWEIVSTFQHDWNYISGKKRLRWPLIVYFFGRYILFAALIGITVAVNVRSPVDCQVLYTVNQFLGNAAIGFASLNLALRTVALWSRSRNIVIPIVLLILGHWSLLLHGVLVEAVWIPEAGGCTIQATRNQILAAIFIYSMVFDFIVFILAGWKLKIFGVGRSNLGRMILGDGLIYFLVAFLANLIATVFMLLNLNGVMSIIANVPATVASMIAAGRAVRHLNQYTSNIQITSPTDK